MDDLKVNLERILSEKQEKLVPENIKKGVQIFDVIGTLEQGISNIKLFKSVEDMQSSENNNEDDIALIYNGDIVPIEPNISSSIIYLENTVTLDTPITESGYIFAGMAQISYSNTNFSIRLMNNDIQYISEDGIVYNRTDSIGNPVTLEYPIEIGTEDFKPFVASFIKLKLTKFGGIYTYKSSQWQLLQTDLSNVENWQIMPYTTVYGNNGIVEGSEDLYKHLNMWLIHKYLMNDTPSDAGYNSIYLDNLSQEQLGLSMFKSFSYTTNLNENINLLAETLLYRDPKLEDCYISNNDIGMLCKDNIGYIMTRSNSITDTQYTIKIIKIDFNTNTIEVIDKGSTPCRDLFFLNFNNDKSKISAIFRDGTPNVTDIYEYDINTQELNKVHSHTFSSGLSYIMNISLDDRYIIYKEDKIIKKESFEGEISSILTPEKLSACFICPNPNYIIYKENDIGDDIKIYNQVTKSTIDISLSFSVNHLSISYLPEDLNLLFLRNTFSSGSDEGSYNYFLIENNEIKYKYNDYRMSAGLFIIRNSYLNDNNIIGDAIIIDKNTGDAKYINPKNGLFTMVYINKYSDDEISYFCFDNINYKRCNIKPIILYDKIYEGDQFLLVNNKDESSISGVIKAIY